MTCRLCLAAYADPFGDAADRRCPTCRARGRWWTREQLGTRAQAWITSRGSEFVGETGIGERVSTPGDGWRVTLASGGMPMYFGAASVQVDFELPRLQAAERSVFAMAERQMAAISQQRPRLKVAAGIPVVCDVPGRQASQRPANAK